MLLVVKDNTIVLINNQICVKGESLAIMDDVVESLSEE